MGANEANGAAADMVGWLIGRRPRRLSGTGAPSSKKFPIPCFALHLCTRNNVIQYPKKNEHPIIQKTRETNYPLKTN
jgi:hypothetical protein